MLGNCSTAKQKWSFFPERFQHDCVGRNESSSPYIAESLYMNIEYFFFHCMLNKCSAFVSEEIADLTNVKSEAARTRSFLSPSLDGACTPPAVQLPGAHPVAGGEPGGHQHTGSLLWEAPREPPPLELDA